MLRTLNESQWKHFGSDCYYLITLNVSMWLPLPSDEIQFFFLFTYFFSLSNKSFCKRYFIIYLILELVYSYFVIKTKSILSSNFNYFFFCFIILYFTWKVINENYTKKRIIQKKLSQSGFLPSFSFKFLFHLHEWMIKHMSIDRSVKCCE